MPAAVQSTLFPELTAANLPPRPVNVASVPQRSPFRYPGGKTWFVPTYRAWIAAAHHARPGLLVEPFAGGGIISLTTLFENLAERVLMVELDADVAAVWRCITDGDGSDLAQRILSFDLTRDNVAQALANQAPDNVSRAFQTILKNRTFHGGILADGAGLLKEGESGRGIASRWYPETLARRLRDIASFASHMEFTQGDGLAVLAQHAGRKDAVFFIDPPYTAGGKKAGKRLYRHAEIDHERLFTLCANLCGDFLMTYDDADEVKTLARRHGFDMRLIPMNNTHHATMEELVIGRDLSWMDAYPSVHQPAAMYRAGVCV